MLNSIKFLSLGHYHNNCYCLAINESYIRGLIWVLFLLSGPATIWLEARRGVHTPPEVVKVLMAECDTTLTVSLRVRKILPLNLTAIFLEDCYTIGLLDWSDNHRTSI